MRETLRRLLAGELTVEEAENELARRQLLELGGKARLDLGRTSRRGLPEVILAAGKTPDDTAQLLIAMVAEQSQGLASRLTPQHWAAVESACAPLEIHRYSTCVRVSRPGFVVPPRQGKIAVLTAGTSDVPAAEEVVMVGEACGFEVRLECDLGVAGLHRLMGPLAEILSWNADVIVVAAGMDGVLPGIVAGLVDLPVIGLPISTGYGMGGNGEAALLTMLQSCATGLTVVNIDNGIGAAAAAVLIAGRAAQSRSTPAHRRRERD
ncbi:MAG TPA: nickel pincer cofactor biosynthesis protein LarB [Candidatus Dormibacteraeota bacterium]|jgi:hypothetical protein|nr:nickel pincer cofactor biosynthesis protein LarB [Candidatus Dormibacteraeota bacterium]